VTFSSLARSTSKIQLVVVELGLRVKTLVSLILIRLLGFGVGQVKDIDIIDVVGVVLHFQLGLRSLALCLVECFDVNLLDHLLLLLPVHQDERQHTCTDRKENASDDSDDNVHIGIHLSLITCLRFGSRGSLVAG